MSETQRQVARRHFAPERLVAQYEALYGSLPGVEAEVGVEIAA